VTLLNKTLLLQAITQYAGRNKLTTKMKILYVKMR